MYPLKEFSKKQLQVFGWWLHREHAFEGIICDGAIRSGKTFSMSLSFILWSFSRFSGNNFALCGKTILSLRRNVVRELVVYLQSMGFQVTERYTQNFLDISIGNKSNRYYLFGGYDESSAAKIQGITLAGVLFDEVVLMPQSFVHQAVARCSVTGSKFWFNCNPEHPYHWFYKEWIQQAKSKKLFYLHFTMKDNPSLSPAVKERYRKLYTGTFYKRFISGEWVQTQGAIYSEFKEELHCFKGAGPSADSYYISCDYGIQNPFSLGLYAVKQDKVYRVKEVYYDGRKEGITLTDLDYYNALKQLAGEHLIKAVVVDPSASSFISLIAQKGEFQVMKANNNVLEGISQVSRLLKEKRLFVEEGCTNCLREFQLYCWSNHKQGDTPLKQNDHTMDELRYLVSTVVFGEQKKASEFFVLSAPR